MVVVIVSDIEWYAHFQELLALLQSTPKVSTSKNDAAKVDKNTDGTAAES